MALPAQVERDLKEIEELEKQLAAPVQQVKDEETDEVEAQEPQLEDTEPEPKKPDSQVEAQPSEDFRQKYNTLRGKYDAEVPRLHAQVKELAQQVERLSQAKQTEQQTETETKTYVTDADREEFGEDLINVQRRVAQEVSAQYEGKVSKLEQTIENLTKRLDETGGKIGEMSFEQRLNQLVPDFAQVNRDPQWVAWLDGFDPILRGPRRSLAQKAFGEGDAEAVADYVKLFRGEQQPEPIDPRKAELEKQVAPTRNNTRTTPTSNAPKVYTEGEMNKAWNKVNTLNKAGRYEEANKLEADLSTAMLEGRVR